MLASSTAMTRGVGRGTSIAVQEGGGASIQRGVLLMGDEHGDPGAILAGGKLLLGHKVLGRGVPPLQLGLPEQRGLCTA